jgi:hypothetical protein
MVFPRAKLMDGVAHAKGVSSCTMEILSQRLRVICVPRSLALHENISNPLSRRFERSADTTQPRMKRT